MISHADAQKAIDTLSDYIKICQQEIDSIADARGLALSPRPVLPEGFCLEDMNLDVRSYNILKDYYRYEKGRRGLLNTSATGLMRTRNCGKKTLNAIEKQFNKHGIMLFP